MSTLRYCYTFHGRLIRATLPMWLASRAHSRSRAL